MKKSVLIAIFAVLAATLACSIFVGGPAYPEGTVPISSQSAQDQLDLSVTAEVETGLISVQLTEAQLTSFLAAKLKEQAKPLLNEPVVLLRDGQIEIYGKVRSGIFTANVRISAQASIDEDGQPSIQIIETDFGPLAAPQGLNEALAAFVREALTGWLGPVATGFRLERIEIGDGVMTVTGRIK